MTQRSLWLKSNLIFDLKSHESWTINTGKELMDQVKNILHPNKVKKVPKKVYDDYIKSPLQKGYTYYKNYTKKLGDVKTPLRYEAATPLGSIKVPKTVSEVTQDLKKATVQMAKKLDEKIGGKGTGNVQTGGRNNLSVDEYFRQEAEASKMYDSIRASTSDVQAISKNTGISEIRIQRIKDHVFNNEHIKSSGNGRFDPDYEIAQAWTRLQQGTYNSKDIDLLNHELFESRFEGIFKTNYETAHDAAIRSGRPLEVIINGSFCFTLERLRG